MLLPPLGSVSFACTLAVLVTVPGTALDGTAAVIVKLVAAPDTSGPTVQVTVSGSDPLPLQLALDEATNCQWAGNVSVTVAPLESDGPRFVTSSVYV